eukprot:scaffold14039_cov37-Tisochrysis_lutea.AAC.1
MDVAGLRSELRFPSAAYEGRDTRSAIICYDAFAPAHGPWGSERRQRRRCVHATYIFEHDHVLRERLCKSEEGSFGVEPRVRAELLRVWLERLHNPTNSELEVALRAVKRADHQVYDA